jgi:hypothetical protein
MNYKPVKIIGIRQNRETRPYKSGDLLALGDLFEGL